jgi:hypothetical protein
VRLPNLPLYFWGFLSLESIFSALGKFHFASHETVRHNTSTYAFICMEINFRKGFPTEVVLTSKNYSWPQKLNYERVFLHCISCFEIGNLASHCPKGTEMIKKHRKSTWWVGSNDIHQVISKAYKEPPQDNEKPPQSDPLLQDIMLSQDSCQNSTEKQEKEEYTLEDSDKGLQIQQSL